MSLVLHEQVSLKPYNTFGIDVRAACLVHARTDDEVRQALVEAQRRHLPVVVLGAGSNVLLTQDLQALVLHMAATGRRVLSDDGVQVIVEAEAGEPWHAFVQWSLAHGFSAWRTSV